MIALKKVVSGLRTLSRRYDHLLESGYLLLMREFLNSIENDTRAPISLAEGTKYIGLVEAIKKSLSTGSDVNA